MNPVPGAQDVLDNAHKLGCPVSESQAQQLAIYLALLSKYNKRMNLVGPGRWTTIFNTLVVDSLYLAKFLASLKLVDNPLTLDLGAGAGLPGIPLRMLWDCGDYWLVEVRQRRASFMRTALGQLGLAHTYVFEGRAQDALKHISQNNEPCHADLVLSRAFMPWEKLLDFVRPMLAKGMENIFAQVVILSNDAPPTSGALPLEWTLVASSSYPVAGGERYFWSLAPC